MTITVHTSKNNELRPQGRDPRIDLLKELADPLRLRVVDRLGQGGPATVSRLAAELDVALPQLSNHLRRLREAGLVRVERTGRHGVYALADPGLELLLPLLDRITGRVAASTGERASVGGRSRTCYRHLAGHAGVRLYDALHRRDALRERADGLVDLGPSASEVFAALGLDIASIKRGRPRLAFECLDATERLPHLAGALGDALAATLFARGWVERETDSRTVRVTRKGANALRRTLDLELPPG